MRQGEVETLQAPSPLSPRAALSVAAAGLAVCAALFASAGSAGAATLLEQRPGPLGCVTETGLSGQCQDGRGMVGSASIALSPDGKNAYVASPSWDSVSTLARDPGDGSLRPIEQTAACFHSLEAVLYLDCTYAPGLEGVYDVAVSPDGENVYVATPDLDAVRVFGRDQGTGLLTPQGCVNQAGTEGCADGRALDEALAVVVSPDGARVYTASSGFAGGIAVFERDPGTGALTQLADAAGCVNETGSEMCTDGHDQLEDLYDVAISPDGASVYAAARNLNAVTVYDVEPGGSLLPLPLPEGCVNEKGSAGCLDGKALIRAEQVVVSPDGQNVYVAAERSDAVAVFDRGADGTLDQKPGQDACYSNSGWSNPQQAATEGECMDGEAMDGIDSIAILPDGSALYATARESDSLTVFERLGGGGLVQLPGTAGCITETGRENPALPYTAGSCQDGRALLEANRVVAGEGSDHAYSVGMQGGAATFDVVEAPAPPAPPSSDPGTSLPDTSTADACAQASADARKARTKLRSARRLLRRAKARRPGVHRARSRVRRARSRVRHRQASLRIAEKHAKASCASVRRPS